LETRNIYYLAVKVKRNLCFFAYLRCFMPKSLFLPRGSAARSAIPSALSHSLNDILRSYIPPSARFSIMNPIFSKSWSIWRFSISTAAVNPRRPLFFAR